MLPKFGAQSSFFFFCLWGKKYENLKACVVCAHEVVHLQNFIFFFFFPPSSPVSILFLRKKKKTKNVTDFDILDGWGNFFHPLFFFSSKLNFMTSPQRDVASTQDHSPSKIVATCSQPLNGLPFLTTQFFFLISLSQNLLIKGFHTHNKTGKTSPPLALFKGRGKQTSARKKIFLAPKKKKQQKTGKKIEPNILILFWYIRRHCIPFAYPLSLPQKSYYRQHFLYTKKLP